MKKNTERGVGVSIEIFSKRHSTRSDLCVVKLYLEPFDLAKRDPKRHSWV